MAKCSLVIELDEPDRIYTSKDKIRGCVVVRADADVNCKALRVRSGWATHGRGNVDSSDSQTAKLFEGQWRSGEEHRYRFELPVVGWPPTYHGSYLSVDHYVHATADIPWAFDPKTSQPYRVHSTAAPDAGVATKPQMTNPVAAKILKIVFFTFLAFMLLNPMLWIVGIPIGIIAGLWWFFKRYLPKKLLGKVEYTLDRERWEPGETLSATLRVHPSKPININSIIWTVKGEEVCVSGSGSNRRTHRVELFSGGMIVDDIKQLPGNQETRIPLQLQLPNRPCYTMKLGANQIVWESDVRIDIPRWPDWTGKQTIQLVPSSEVVDAVAVETATEDFAVTEPGNGWNDMAAQSPTEPEAPDVTFEATLEMIHSVLNDSRQLDRIIDAVHELPMQLNLMPQRRELYGSGNSKYAYSDGHVVVGQTIEPVIPVTMFIPRSLADEFDQASDREWSGQGSIVGYDHRQNRLQLRIEP